MTKFGRSTMEPSFAFTRSMLEWAVYLRYETPFPTSKL